VDVDDVLDLRRPERHGRRARALREQLARLCRVVARARTIDVQRRSYGSMY
jgi:hypothetical protein